ncbi:MAG TPA: CoA transferase [Solirubrobacterales bacterium]|nr:CoA transferase [Solirubrobacterales bacterium]
MSGSPDKRPLAGVRVIDISTSIAAPTATMYLADLGADVIKVERPGTGDDARSWGPPFVGGQAPWFAAANRNKRSICLDLHQPAGREALFQLLESADVFVESLTPGKLAKLGLHPESVLPRIPRLIYCAMSGFGLDGPDHDQPGYDLIAQARGGLMSVTGATGGPPQRVSTALSDIVAGMIAAFAITAALRRQLQTGEGELIDVNLLEANLALLGPRIASFLAGEPEPRPSGATDSVIAIYQSFETADRSIVIAVGTDAMWLRLCDALEMPDLAKDERLATNEGRRRHREELVGMLAERLLSADAETWLARLRAAAIPCSPVQFLSEVLADPQVLAREVIVETANPGAEPISTIGSPWRLGSSPNGVEHRPAPLLGDATREVLREVGYEENEVDQLIEEGVAM